MKLRTVLSALKASSYVEGPDVDVNADVIVFPGAPLEEAIAEMDAIMYAPISIEDRSLGNVMKIVLKNGMTEFKDEDRFASFFGVFDKIANKEKRRYAKALAGEDE